MVHKQYQFYQYGVSGNISHNKETSFIHKIKEKTNT